jgi:diguanylate cyclase (GGDEF)-like protein
MHGARGVSTGVIRVPIRRPRRLRAAARTIPGKLAALVALAVAALVLVGSVVLSQQVAQQQALDRLVTFREVLSRQQDADMMHDALRSEVYVAFAQADRPARVAQSKEAISAVRNRGERAFLANRTALTMLGGEAAAVAELDRAAAGYARLAGAAQASVELVDRLGPAEAIPARSDFDVRFRTVEEEMAQLTGRMTTLSEDAASAADSAGLRARTVSIVVSLLALLGVGGLGWATWRGVRAALREKAIAEGELRLLVEQTAATASRHQFGAELGDALEMADTEASAHRVVAEALAATVPDSPSELLLADSSQAGLLRVVENPSEGGPGCPVSSPWSCVAVRRGRTQEFAHGDALNACPHLRNRASGPVSAVCVPVTFMGRPLGVLHTTGAAGDPPTAEAGNRLTQIAAQSGTRIGTLRATRKTELQAATDGLTGLLNRRSLEVSAGELLQKELPFAIAMADLDHFKQLNDTYGHEVGDRALRMFANVLRTSLRGEDLIARYGGEEFVIVLPERSMIDAAGTLNRLRERLADASQRGGTPTFTASFGLADTGDGSVLEEILRVADSRLRAAKMLGRDRIVTTDGGTPNDQPVGTADV